MIHTLLVTALLGWTLAFQAGGRASPPGGHQHAPAQDHAHQGMGFDQEKTTHHFWIERAGGTIGRCCCS